MPIIALAAVGILAAFAAWSSGSVAQHTATGPDASPPVVAELGALVPDFRAKFSGFLIDASAAGTPLRVLETLRTYERQAFLWDQGRARPGAIVTNARPGTSKHETGRAADTWPVGVSLSDNATAIARLSALVPLASKWGLKNLPNQGDYGHWEDA